MGELNLLDITIKYFNVIVFVLCVIFGITSIFASWAAWREIHRKKNIVRSIIAIYNISEDALENGKTPKGDFRPDPVLIQTFFFTIQEVLNAMYGEITGKPIPPKESRSHGSRLLGLFKSPGIFGRKRENLPEAEFVQPQVRVDEKRSDARM